jgi:DNA gyrase subunit A
MNNDVLHELGTNFIEYAVAVNTDRAIPNATDGLKPVAKRILYGAYDCGFKYEKPHVKCANIVGNVMADWHPHGDSSIYGALVRLSQNWVMRYPLIDFHGSNGNIDGDGPAAYRYTEARLAKIVEDGMLNGIKKNAVDFTSNYSETKLEPIELPAVFPNLLCNPNSGIGVAMACNWAPHNLREVAAAINAYINGEEPTLPGPDFPTGGIIINKNDIPTIMRTGHGSVKVRGKYQIEKNNIVFTELPYGVGTENIMNQIGAACDAGKINGVDDIRNESNKKGFRLVIECDKNASLNTVVNKLFAETDLQTSFSYNQVALVDKTPTELNLKDCIKIYVEYNTKCITREAEFDMNKAIERLEVVLGLIKALDIIDQIIQEIKNSESSAVAKETLQKKYQFSESQAKAILDMKLSRLAKLEKQELIQEKEDLTSLIKKLDEIRQNPLPELQKRLAEIVVKYGDERRTELAQVEIPKEEKEIAYVEPEKCVVVMTESGLIKRIPTASFRKANRNTKGVKTQDDITHIVIRTNTIDNLMIFSNKGMMYRLLVDNIPVGTNASQGTNIKALVPMAADETPATIYSIYRETDAKYVLFATKNGLVKRTSLEEYTKTKKKSGLQATKINDDDELVSVSLMDNEDIVMLTKQGMSIHFKGEEISIYGRTAAGLKGINLKEGDEVVAALPIRDVKDNVAIFTENGVGKQVVLSDFTLQKRGGKGVAVSKLPIAAASMLNNEDKILIMGDKNNLCISGEDIPVMGRTAQGVQLIKDNKIISVSKV